MNRISTYGFLVALSLLGCETQQGMSPLISDGGMSGCESDLECGVGLVCVRRPGSYGGLCRLGDCNLERSCNGGQTCDRESYSCIGEGDRSCLDRECPAGRMCDMLTGECAATGAVLCRGHTDCAGGLCIDRVCRDVECAIDEHCGQNRRCNDENRCETIVIECHDGDEDGYGVGAECLGLDCDDSDPLIHSGVQEDGETLCGDGIDNNCDGRDQVCGALDGDGDGFTVMNGDCDDSNPSVHPGAPETPYNGLDDDCDPSSSDDDLDRDGYAALRSGGNDCDDSEFGVNPDAEEIPGNGVDENCDGFDSRRSDEDRDSDGFSEVMGDCDDDDGTVHPSANEVPYNARDDDCNPATPDDDLDMDGFILSADCDDSDPGVNPATREIYYNRRDDDCNPDTVDEDADGDGYRASEMNGPDCNDRAPLVYIDALEVPYNGVDDDCNPNTPDDDLDLDGVGLAEDCDDQNRDINPNSIENARENCSDGIDHDCRGGDVLCDEFPNDDDGDGVPDEQDCEPLNPNIPGPREILGNGLDDDCNRDTADLLNQCLDDGFDVVTDNGLWTSASEVGDGNTRGAQFGGLILCPHDTDWYYVDVQEGDGLEVRISFAHADGNLDLRLYRPNNEGVLEVLDTSRSTTNDETVYLRTNSGTSRRYYVQVYRMIPSDEPATYSMTVNIFDRCADDVPGPSGEQNDSAPEAAELPPPGERRQICDYDEDWYRFTVEEQTRVNLHLLFDSASGDLDMSLFDREGARLSSASTIDDNELIEIQLQPGEYTLRVYGYQAAQNDYVLIRSDRPLQRTRSTLEEDAPIPDLRRGRVGVLERSLTFDVPPGALIRRLTVRDLHVEHDFLNDLLLTMLWDGEHRATLWNREGQRGQDGGLDDDFLPFTSDDIDFDHRTYEPFAGLPADGTLTLRIEDRAERYEGRLTDFEVDLEFFLP